VVSPYNMQVNHLKRTLGEEGTRCTVDQFQGRKPSGIVSMATSSPEEIPRGIDFRTAEPAECVAVSRTHLFDSSDEPEPDECPVQHVEQMKLVNTLCWAREYSMRSPVQ